MSSTSLIPKISLVTLRETFPGHPFFTQPPTSSRETSTLLNSALEFLEILRFDGRTHLITSVVSGRQTCDTLAHDLEQAHCEALGANWSGKDVECGYLIMICGEGANELTGQNEDQYDGELDAAYDYFIGRIQFNKDWMDVEGLKQFRKKNGV